MTGATSGHTPTANFEERQKLVTMTKPKHNDESSNDWLTSLVKQAATGDSLTSKQERIEKRANKKRRRQERKNHDDLLEHHLSNKRNKKKAAREPKEKVLVPAKKSHTAQKSGQIVSTLATQIDQTARALLSEGRPRLYEGTKVSLVKKRKWNEDSIQPRKNDYGGIGLARKSLFLSLHDPSFAPKLEEEFKEHIQGFFGKQRTKAMKKQSKMLWKEMAEKKNLKVNGKKLGDLSPDERVEAMLKAGMI